MSRGSESVVNTKRTSKIHRYTSLIASPLTRKLASCPPHQLKVPVVITVWSQLASSARSSPVLCPTENTTSTPLPLNATCFWHQRISLLTTTNWTRGNRPTKCPIAPRSAPSLDEVPHRRTKCPIAGRKAPSLDEVPHRPLDVALVGDGVAARARPAADEVTATHVDSDADKLQPVPARRNAE